MKKQKFYIMKRTVYFIIGTLIVLFVSSCEKEAWKDITEPFYEPIDFAVSADVTSMYALDPELTATITLTTEESISSLNVAKNIHGDTEEDLGTVSFSGGTGTFTVTRDQLGMNQGDVNLYFWTWVNEQDNVRESRKITFKVEDPVTITNNGSGYLVYEVLDGVTLPNSVVIKVGVDGGDRVDIGGSWDMKKDSVLISDHGSSGQQLSFEFRLSNGNGLSKNIEDVTVE